VIALISGHRQRVQEYPQRPCCGEQGFPSVFPVPQRRAEPGQLEAVSAQEILQHRSSHFSGQGVAKLQPLLGIVFRKRYSSRAPYG
jgi:hypothetical protein